MNYFNWKTSDMLFCIRRTLLEMVSDRCYAVFDSEIQMTKQLFLEKYGMNVTRGDLDFRRAKRNDPKDEICVFFVEEEKTRTEVLRSYAKCMESPKVFRAILVLQQLAIALVREFIEKGMAEHHIEFFLDEEVLINITKHSLVPKHQMLMCDEAKTLMEHYNVDETQLPQIQVDDPVARYYGLKVGHIVKITRLSETAGRYDTSRCGLSL